MTPELMRSPTSVEPHLKDMTRAALDTLDRINNRFFVMIEGGVIDLVNHVESLDAQIAEVAAFDDAVGAALDWINASEERKQHTLLIVLVDHETGGFAVMGSEVPGPVGQLPGTFTGGWAFVITPPAMAGHTGTDTDDLEPGARKRRTRKGDRQHDDLPGRESRSAVAGARSSHSDCRRMASGR